MLASERSAHTGADMQRGAASEQEQSEAHPVSSISMNICKAKVKPAHQNRSDAESKRIQLS